MHETVSPNVKLNVDKVTKLASSYLIEGWVGSSLGKIVEIWTSNDDRTKDIRLDVAFSNRSDVFNFYPEFGSGDGLGFSFNFDSSLKAKSLIVVLDNGSEEFVGCIHRSIVIKSGIAAEVHKDIIVVDDFYADPDAIREYAINNLTFKPSGYHKGERATEQFIIEGTKEKLEEIIGRKIYNWDYDGYANGIFQFCTADQPLVYHIDTQMMAAIVYLTPDAPVSTGTAMYQHKATKVRNFPNDTRHTSLYGEVFKGVSNDLNFYDSTQYDMVDTVGNVYNRLVIFNASNIHAATAYFGDAIENSRFFHMFFFDVE